MNLDASCIRLLRPGRSPMWSMGCAILLLCVPVVRAQSPEKILKRCAKAMGGEGALKRVKTWEVKGSIKRKGDNVAGTFLAAASQPDLYLLSVDLGGLEASEGFNGKSAWKKDSRSGLRTLTGVENTDFRAEASFRNARWLNYKKEKSRISLAGSATAGGRPAQAVLVTTSRNVKLKLFFDAASGLLVREELPAGAITRVSEYADYRPVDGVAEPFSISWSEGEDRYEIALEKVTHNQPIDRARFDFPKVSSEPLPDLVGLLKKISDNQHATDQLREKYTFTEIVTSREFDKSGTLKEKETGTYEIIFYRGHHIRRLKEKNGKTLSSEDLAKEDRRIEKEVAEIEKSEAKKAKKEQEARDKQKSDGEGDDDRVTVSDVLRTSHLVNPRRERFRDRDVIVFDFEPLPAYNPKRAVEKFMQKLSGVVWVDAKALQIARVEARLIDSYKIGGGLLGSINRGAALVIEQDRINDEIWLPSYSEFNLSARFFLFMGLSLNQTVRYGDYKRFRTEAEGEVKDPVKQVKP